MVRSENKGFPVLSVATTQPKLWLYQTKVEIGNDNDSKWGLRRKLSVWGAGMYVPVRVIPSERVDEQAGAAHVEEVHLQVQGGFRSGTLLVEVVRGAFISPAKVIALPEILLKTEGYLFHTCNVRLNTGCCINRAFTRTIGIHILIIQHYMSTL